MVSESRTPANQSAKKVSSRKKRDAVEISGSADGTREALLKAATQLFSSQGYEATTVRELADAARVNLALVSYHFGGKEGLYRACLEEFGKGKVAAFAEILKAPQSREEFRVRLLMLAEQIFLSYVESPELTRMIHRSCELHLDLVEDVFRSTFIRLFETLWEFVKAGQKNGLVRKSLDSYVTAAQILSMVVHATRNDALAEKFFGRTLRDPKYRTKFLDNFLMLLLDGISTTPSER